jgi:hypothetical protein
VRRVRLCGGDRADVQRRDIAVVSRHATRVGDDHVAGAGRLVHRAVVEGRLLAVGVGLGGDAPRAVGVGQHPAGRVGDRQQLVRVVVGVARLERSGRRHGGEVAVRVAVARAQPRRIGDLADLAAVARAGEREHQRARARGVGDRLAGSGGVRAQPAARRGGVVADGVGVARPVLDRQQPAGVVEDVRRPRVGDQRVLLGPRVVGEGARDVGGGAVAARRVVGGGVDLTGRTRPGVARLCRRVELDLRAAGPREGDVPAGGRGDGERRRPIVGPSVAERAFRVGVLGGDHVVGAGERERSADGCHRVVGGGGVEVPVLRVDGIARPASAAPDQVLGRRRRPGHRQRVTAVEEDLGARVVSAADGVAEPVAGAGDGVDVEGLGRHRLARPGAATVGGGRDRAGAVGDVADRRARRPGHAENAAGDHGGEPALREAPGARRAAHLVPAGDPQAGAPRRARHGGVPAPCALVDRGLLRGPLGEVVGREGGVEGVVGAAGDDVTPDHAARSARQAVDAREPRLVVLVGIAPRQLAGVAPFRPAVGAAPDLVVRVVRRVRRHQLADLGPGCTADDLRIHGASRGGLEGAARRRGGLVVDARVPDDDAVGRRGARDAGPRRHLGDGEVVPGGAAVRRLEDHAVPADRDADEVRGAADRVEVAVARRHAGRVDPGGGAGRWTDLAGEAAPAKRRLR